MDTKFRGKQTKAPPKIIETKIIIRRQKESLNLDPALNL